MRTSVLLSTISAALALSIVTSVNPAMATTPPTPASTTPAPLPIPPPPPRVTQDANGQPMPPASAGSTQIASLVKPSPFAVLDRNRTGVITREQASADPWLSAHFADCDADHDDQVTESEYEACSTQRN